METSKSLEIIETMMLESRKSMVKNSFHFILWAGLLVPAALTEYLLRDTSYFWMVWPVMGAMGGIIAMIYGRRQRKEAGVATLGDRIISYTWGGFVVALVFAIVYSVSLHQSPHTLVFLLTSLAVFINGGISKFKPFIFGASALFVGAFLCGFVVPTEYHSLVFAASILLGYLIPGLQLRKVENGQA
jgi:hypothetical protein